MAKETSAVKNSSTLAKSDDGTIQLTFSIPFDQILKSRQESLSELSNSVNIPGFRPGKAPLGEVEKHVDRGTLVEKTLSRILPKLLATAINEHKIRPATYPKFELISANEGEDWQVRAVTCEIPAIDLGDYKSKVSGLMKSKTIWTPGSDNSKPEAQNPEAERAQKEQQAIKMLLETAKITLPKILIEDEVNARLSRLLEKIEKLGLSLDSYLASIGKNPQSLRGEYELQAKEAISLDLILTKIAEEEKLVIDPKDMELAMKAGQADDKLSKELDTPERKLIIENILRRRKALDFLISLN